MTFNPSSIHKHLGKTRLFFATLLLSTGVLAQSGGQVVVVPVQNPSFEQFSDFRGSDSCGTWYWFINGWAGSNSSAFQPSNPNPCNIALPPNSQTVAVIGYGGQISQTLATTPSQLQNVPGGTNDGLYVFTFWVANFLPKYPGYYTAKVTFGTQELCEASGWGTMKFKQIPIPCTGAQYIVGKSLPGGTAGQGQNPFVLTIIENDGSANGGWPVMIAGPVSLTFDATN